MQSQFDLARGSNVCSRGSRVSSNAALLRPQQAAGTSSLQPACSSMRGRDLAWLPERSISPISRHRRHRSRGPDPCSCATCPPAIAPPEFAPPPWRRRRSTAPGARRPLPPPQPQQGPSDAVPSTSTSSTSSRRPGNCYTCGEPGHWSSNCPNKRSRFLVATTSSSSSADSTPWVLASDLASDPPSPPSPPHLAPQPQAPPLSSLASGSGQLLMPSRHDGVGGRRAVRHHLTMDQRSEQWHTARNSRLTASAFSGAAGISMRRGGSGENARRDLFLEKLGIKIVETNEAMRRGTAYEPVALAEYCRRTGRAVSACDFVTYQAEEDSLAALSGGLLPPGPEGSWLAGSPDGLILGSDAAAGALMHAVAEAAVERGLTAVPAAVTDEAGILEIKCPFYGIQAGDAADKYHKYLFQIQGLMEILDVDWANLFVYDTRRGHSLQVHIPRDPHFWAELLPHLRSFWFQHYLPASQLLDSHLAQHGLASVREVPQAEAMRLVQDLVPPLPPGGATLLLEQWAKEMYARADKVKYMA